MVLLSLMRWHTWLGLLLLMGCGASPLRQTALQGDLPSLRAAITRAVAAGQIDQDAFEDLSEATVLRELAGAQGDQGVARVRDVRTCASKVNEPLEAAAAGDGAVGAAASLALLEIGRADREELLERHYQSERSEWRAVAARAAVGQGASRFRQASMVHDDARVRRAAVHAAFDAPLAIDLAALQAVAAKDPDPLVRSRAIQTLGRLGGTEITQGLLDMWGTADAQTRQVIVRAWASERTFRAGGKQRLLHVMAAGSSLPGLVAAERLLHLDKARLGQAEAYLLAALQSSPPDERHLAIQWAPTTPSVQKELLLLAAEAPEPTRVVALLRLHSFAGLQRDSLRSLVVLSASKDPAIAEAALRARGALGDRTVVPRLSAILQDTDPHSKLSLARTLLRLKAFAEVAPLLADDSASVRTQVGCAGLSMDI